MKYVFIILNSIKTMLFLFILLIGSVALIPALSIVLFLRSLVWVLAKLLRPDLDSFVTKENSLFATKNSSRATLNIVCTSVMEGAVSKEQLQESMEERVLCLRDSKGKYLFEGLKNSWEGFLGYAFWKRDKDFDIKNHVRDYDYGGKLQVPNPCSVEDYRRVLGGLSEAPWDRRWSPWEILVIPNYVDGNEGFKTGVIFRIDHVLADGYSIMDMTKHLTQSPFPVPGSQLGRNNKFTFLEKMGLALKVPWDLARNMCLVLGATKLRYDRKFSPEDVIISVSPKISVECIKDIKNHFKVSYAAVVYAAIFGAIERGLKCSGQKGPEKLATGFILPKMGHPQELCIHATGVLAEWPMTSSSTVARLQSIQKSLKNLTHSTAPLAYPFIATLGGLFPMVVRRLLTTSIINLGLSIGFSNFPVTTGPDYYEGHEMLELTVTVGTWSTLGIFMITGGLNNKQVFSFSVNKSVFASEMSARNLGIYVEEEFQALLNEMV